MNPPETITLLFCPKCGRDDRVKPLAGASHFDRGFRCNGKPVTVTYERKEQAEIDQLRVALEDIASAPDMDAAWRANQALVVSQNERKAQ